jgi:hypothetical protein
LNHGLVSQRVPPAASCLCGEQWSRYRLLRFRDRFITREGFSSALLDSALEWFWTSTDENPRPTATLPEKRPLTHLSEISRSAFLDDLCDDRGGEGRAIAMAGFLPGASVIVSAKSKLSDALAEFALSGGGPVQALYCREDDGDEVFYSAWPLTEPVRQLIGSWLIRPDEIRDFHWTGWRNWESRWLEGTIAELIERA